MRLLPVLSTLALGAALVSAPAPASAGSEISNIIFMNRCATGCTIIGTGSVNNARTNESSIPGNQGANVISAFSHGDDRWNEIVACVQDVYAPFNVVITDVDPGPDVDHHEAIVAGRGSEIGLANPGTVGTASGGIPGCDPVNNGISFSFANAVPGGDVDYICDLVAQETAHSFGIIDHTYDCTDPMSYLAEEACPQAYFRNKFMGCHLNGINPPIPSACTCGGSVINTHQHLLTIFGPGEASPPPTTEVLFPTEGAQIGDNTPFQIEALDKRGVSRIEVYFNGWLWGEYQESNRFRGADFNNAEWPSSYIVNPTEGFPGGVIDVEVRAFNDLGGMGTATMTVNRGGPCTSADSCLEGQKCEEGRCFWDQPVGEFTDECTYDEYCIGDENVYDGVCHSEGDVSMCTRACYTGVNDDCPEGYECLETNAADQSGVCWFPPESGGGCCSSADQGGRAVLGQILLVGVLGLLVLRRKGRA